MITERDYMKRGGEGFFQRHRETGKDILLSVAILGIIYTIIKWVKRIKA